MNMRIYLLQRGTAAVLALLVFVHLGVIAYAVQDGLSAAEILSRTRGSAGWAMFYGLFVLAAAIHGSIGLYAILVEWGRTRRGMALVISALAACVMLYLGFEAVRAVTAGGA